MTEDHRGLLFEGGLYVIGEDCLILSPVDNPTKAYFTAIAALRPHGQLVEMRESELPARVKKMIEDQRQGWFQAPGDDYPILPGELPEFPCDARSAEIQDV